MLMGVAGLLLKPGGTVWAGMICAILGAAALWLMDKNPASENEPLKTDDAPVMLRLWPLAVGIALLTLLCSVNAGGWPPQTPAWAQAALLFGGIGLCGMALWGPITRPRLTVTRAGMMEAGLVAGITLLAFGLRAVNLEYAVHQFMDEMHNVSAITRLWGNPNVAILTPHGDVPAFTWLYPMLQSAAETYYGPTLTALRVVSAAFGALTVLALWGLARVLFDRKVALAAALLLATFPPHIHFSRIGLNNIADPLFGTLALALLARAYRSGKQSYFALAGIALGMTQYFYEGGRLLYPPLALAFAGLCVWQRMRRGERPLWRQSGVFGAMSIIAAAPVYITLISNNLPLLPRLDETATRAFDLAQYPGNVIDALLLTVHNTDAGWFYQGRTALVLAALVPLLLLGIAHAVRRINQPRMALPLLWLLATALGNGLLEDVLWTPRYVVVFPALALLLAIGVVYTMRLLPLPATGIRLALAGIACAAALWQTGYYFGTHLERFNAASVESQTFDDVMFRIATLPQDTFVHVVGEAIILRYNTDTYLRYRGRFEDITLNIVRDDAISAAYLANLSPGRPHAFFVAPDDTRTVRLLESELGIERAFLSPYDAVPEARQYRLYYTGFVRD
jgi:hypothetical protein